jgi:RNA polymerase sigma-70 factor (ECF subfamily)
MIQNSEKTLILECQTGSQSAYKKLVEMYYQDAYAMALVRTQNSEVALDISQEAFIRIFRNIKKFDFEHSFKAWLYTIVKNLCLNYLERYKKRRVVFTDFLYKSNVQKLFVNEPDVGLDRDEIKSLCWQSLNQLKSQDRDIILLKDFEDYSYQDISEVLNIPIGTVMSRLFHARKKLATILRKYQSVKEK